MALFPVQHGRSAAKNIDPHKGVTDQGREETKRITAITKGIPDTSQIKLNFLLDYAL